MVRWSGVMLARWCPRVVRAVVVLMVGSPGFLRSGLLGVGAPLWERVMGVSARCWRGVQVLRGSLLAPVHGGREFSPWLPVEGPSRPGEGVVTVLSWPAGALELEAPIRGPRSGPPEPGFGP